MRTLQFWFFMTCLSTQLQAQDIAGWLKKQLIEKPRERNALNAAKFETYRISGLAFGAVNVQDTRMALNVYSGLSIGAQFGWTEFSEKCYNEINLQVHFASPSFAKSLGNGYIYLHNSLNYTKLYKTNWLNQHLYLGLSLEALDELRLYAYLGNSSLNNDLAISINPMLIYSHVVQLLKREHWFYSKLSVNGFSFVNRFPSYNFILNETRNYWVPIGQFNRIRTEFGISHKLKWSSENRFGISYSWDFYAFNEMDKLFKIRSAQHAISLNWWFKTR